MLEIPEKFITYYAVLEIFATIKEGLFIRLCTTFGLRIFLK